MPHFESATEYVETDPAQAAKQQHEQQIDPVSPHEESQVKALQRRDTERIFFDQAVINGEIRHYLASYLTAKLT
jgi:hypothetical protein